MHHRLRRLVTSFSSGQWSGKAAQCCPALRTFSYDSGTAPAATPFRADWRTEGSANVGIGGAAPLANQKNTRSVCTCLAARNVVVRSIADEVLWRRREKELLDKFSNVVHHLQMEIARQSFLFARQKAELEQQLAEARARNESAITDQLCDALLSVCAQDMRRLGKLIHWKMWALKKRPLEEERRNRASGTI